jgi:hypothetical protein
MLATFSKYKVFRLQGPLEALLLLLSVFLQRYVSFFFLLQIVLCFIQIRPHYIQVVKQRMQTGQFRSAPDAVRLIVAKEGFKGLYAVCIAFDLLLVI